MAQERPFFSIIVPTYGRPENLAACLQSLASLQYPPDRFEVIVVDDGGERSLDELVARFRDQLRVTLLKQLHAGPAAARNTGAVQAAGEFLAFTDDDCAPAPNWLETLADRFAKTPDHAIGGRTLNALHDNLYSTGSQLLIDYLNLYYNPDADHSRFLTSNNLAVPADHFHAICGFDTTFRRAGGEDREFCDRWLSQGYGLIYAPEVCVDHSHALTLRTFWQQHFHYGRGAFQFHRGRARRRREPIRVEPLSFYLNMLHYPFSRVSSWRAFLLGALLVVSQGANFLGFLWERLNRSREMGMDDGRNAQG